MRRIIISLSFIFFVFPIQAQTYTNDLSTLRSVLEKTPSYKTQIKGEQLAAYDALYNRLAADSVSNANDYKYFYNLAQLFFPLRDNHLGFYQVPDYEKFKTRETIAEFITTKAFTGYPKYEINIDSLKNALSEKPAESVEGIYHYDRFYSVGLFKSKDKEYIGVVVESETELWPKGHIAMHLYEYGPNMFKAIYGHPLTKNFILQANEKYVNQSLPGSRFYLSYSQEVYSKLRSEVDHVNLPHNSPKFELKNINDDVQYVLIKTFQNDRTASQQSIRFYDSIKNLLNAPNLILDLRNNAGGAEFQSAKFFKLLKEYLKKGNIYILMNYGTMSQGEIFTLDLKKLKNVTTLGQTTQGTLAYGSNYGTNKRLPSQQFEVYITDMKNSPELLQYESYGIKPDTSLNENSSWIEQVIEIISSAFN